MHLRIVTLTTLLLLCSLLLLGCAQPEPTALPPATRVAKEAAPTVVPTATPPPPPTATPTKALRVVPETKAFLQATPIEGGALIEIVIEEVERLYGAEVHLTFDPAAGQVVDADPDFPGVNPEPGERFPKGKAFAALNQADNDLGKVDLAYTLLNPSPAIKANSLVIARFELMATESIEIVIEQLLLADSDGNPIRVDVQETLSVEVDR